MSLFHADNNRVVIVDSDNRTSGTSTNFSIALQIPTNNYNRCSLLQISVPRSWYDFQTGYNTFQLQEGLTTVTVTIPIGSYTKNSLIQVLKDILNSVSPNNLIYNITYPSSLQANTTKFTFTVSGSFITKFIFTTNCYLQLGFNKNSTNTFTGGSIVSTNIVSLSYINRLFLKSSMCSSANDSILQELLVSSQYPTGSYIYYECNNFDVQSKQFLNNNDNVFDFVLSDRFGNPVDLNGLGIIFSILLYTKDNTSEIMKDHILIKNVEKTL